jgi:hypothetical protein
MQFNQKNMAFVRGAFNTKNLDAMGYILLKPHAGYRYAAIRKYLSAWEDDEADAGLI